MKALARLLLQLVRPTKHLYEGWVTVTLDGKQYLQIRKRRLTWSERVRQVVAMPALLLLQAGTFEFSRVGAQMALNQVFGLVQGPVARSVYLGLCSSAPTDSDTNAALVAKEIFTTPPSNGYARQVFGPTSPSAADPTETHNTSILTFGPLTPGDAPNCTHFFVASFQTGSTGDFLAWGAFAAARDAAVGDSLQVAASALSISLT